MKRQVCRGEPVAETNLTLDLLVVTSTNDEIVDFVLFPALPAESTLAEHEAEHEQQARVLAAQLGHDAPAAPPQRQRVRTRSLHSLLASECVGQRVLLKLDVEGAELAALSALRADDWKRVAAIVAEVRDVDQRLEHMTALLEKRGFRVATQAQHDMALADDDYEIRVHKDLRLYYLFAEPIQS